MPVLTREESAVPPLIFLWSPPRSLSTAFLRMMIERGDFEVLHEPFSSVVVQGYVVVNGEKISDTRELLRFLSEYSKDNRVFVKETTEYRYDVVDDPQLARLGTHTFIVRDPRAVIPSHYSMNQHLTCQEVGFEHLYEIFQKVRNVIGGVPAVVQAEGLMADPGREVADYCKRVGIPFKADALSWRPGERDEWKRTREWHRSVASSNGFADGEQSYSVHTENNPRLAEFYRYQLPFYQRIRNCAGIAV
jgi:hypothetical protein